MTAVAQEVVAAFEALPAVERDAVLAELLTRHPLGEGELSDQALVELAEELFLTYDAEESANATPPR